MKLCWDNIEDLYLTSKGNLRKRNYPGILWVIKICKQCEEEFLAQKRCKGYYCSLSCSGKAHTGKNNGFFGKTHTDKVKSMLRKSLTGKGSPRWKGGYHSKGFPFYDTYAPQLEWCEEVKRNPKDQNILEVRCTYCGRWMIPTIVNVRNRLNLLNNIDGYTGELRFYCSINCKKVCPIYGKKTETLMKEDAIRAGNNWLELNREVQPELRKLVLARDGYQCTKCNSNGPLHCHHIYPVSIDPLESADMDNCIILCVDCHKETHQKDGCKYGQLKICIEYK